MQLGLSDDLFHKMQFHVDVFSAAAVSFGDTKDSHGLAL